MSLETINKKLREVEKAPFVDILLPCATAAIMSIAIATIFNPTIWEQYDDPIVRSVIFTMLALSFTVTYLVIFAGGVISGIVVTWILLKSRDKFYIKNGIIIGNSLSTNHEFLKNLANGLLPKLIWFIRGYNDPKIEALQNQLLEKDRRINELEKLILPHIARQNRRQFDFDLRVKNIESKLSEKTQTIEDKAYSKTNYENTDLKKFKEDL